MNGVFQNGAPGSHLTLAFASAFQNHVKFPSTKRK